MRHCRQWFAEGAVEALRSTLAPGPSAAKGERALEVASAVLREPVENRTNWTLPRLCAEVERQTGTRLPFAHEPPAQAKRGFRWRRPRHTLKGRQDADEVDRIGLRPRLRRQQAQAGDIVLLCGDKSEALTHPYLAHAWAKRGADLRVTAPGQARKVAMMGVLDAMTRELIVHTSATKRSTDFIALLEKLDIRFGPRPRRKAKPVVLVLDNGPIHTSTASTAALAARNWITVEWLPRYAPELNGIELGWWDLKRHYFAHQTFQDTVVLDVAIHHAVGDWSQERRNGHPCDKPQIAA